MKPSLFVSGLLIFFSLAIGTTVGAAEVDAGKELYIAILQFLPRRRWTGQWSGQRVSKNQGSGPDFAQKK